MSLQSEQIGKIDTKKIIRNIMNALITQQLGINQLHVKGVDFLGTNFEIDFTFRITLNRISTELQNNFLDVFYALFKINSEHINVVNHDSSHELYFKDTSAILKLFEAIGYERLLDNRKLCLAYQVDLLQLLIAETLHLIIADRIGSAMPPESIEFDATGNLSAIVMAPDNTRYKIHNITEMNIFLTKYYSYALPNSFIELIREQITISTLRYVRSLTTPNAGGTLLIFAENRLTALQLCEHKKHLSASLERRSPDIEPLTPQERRLFQVYLASKLGESFSVIWRSSGKHYRLIISSASSRGFTTTDVQTLNHVLSTQSLVSQTEIDALQMNKILGVRGRAIYAMPASVEEILECKILLTLPEETPVITPTGNSYNLVAIIQHLDSKNTPNDPISRQPLTISQLRSNVLAQRLIHYYQEITFADKDPDVYPPTLLIDPKTGTFYVDPVVLLNGETVSRQDSAENSPYPNHCVAELIAYYDTTLVARHSSIYRLGIRATIGANLGLLCPGIGALTEEVAADESEILLPYVEYDALTETLSIHFACQEYARRFELGLKRWDTTKVQFTSETIIREITQTKKTIRDIANKRIDQIFHSTVSIIGEDTIAVLFEQVCSLSPAYVNKLKTLPGSTDMDILNRLIQSHMLGICTDTNSSNNASANASARLFSARSSSPLPMQADGEIAFKRRKYS